MLIAPGQPPFQVSILVLLEWSSEDHAGGIDDAEQSQFQSLFYWNGLLRFCSVQTRAMSERVSILVLLEWSSEAEVYDTPGHAMGFQSLFYWNGLLRSIAFRSS